MQFKMQHMCFLFLLLGISLHSHAVDLRGHLQDKCNENKFDESICLMLADQIMEVFSENATPDQALAEFERLAREYILSADFLAASATIGL